MFNVHIEYTDGSKFDNERCTATMEEILRDIWESVESVKEPTVITITEVKDGN